MNIKKYNNNIAIKLPIIYASPNKSQIKSRNISKTVNFSSSIHADRIIEEERKKNCIFWQDYYKRNTNINNFDESNFRASYYLKNLRCSIDETDRVVAKKSLDVIVKDNNTISVKGITSKFNENIISEKKDENNIFNDSKTTNKNLEISLNKNTFTETKKEEMFKSFKNEEIVQSIINPRVKKFSEVSTLRFKVKEIQLGEVEQFKEKSTKKRIEIPNYNFYKSLKKQFESKKIII